MSINYNITVEAILSFTHNMLSKTGIQNEGYFFVNAETNLQTKTVQIKSLKYPGDNLYIIVADSV